MNDDNRNIDENNSEKSTKRPNDTTFLEQLRSLGKYGCSDDSSDDDSSDDDSSDDVSSFDYDSRGRQVLFGSYETTVNMMIDFQIHFPYAFQMAIQMLAERHTIETLEEGNNLDYKTFYKDAEQAVHCLLTEPTAVLDSETVTQDQVEVLIRTFPYALAMKRESVGHGKLLYEYPTYWVTTCPKSIRFAPLIVKMMLELKTLPYYCFPEFLNGILKYEPTDDQHERLLEAFSLSIMKDLKKRWIDFEGSHEQIDKCLRMPCRMGKTFRFLIDWHPTILKGTYLLKGKNDPPDDTSECSSEYKKSTIPLVWRCANWLKYEDHKQEHTIKHNIKRLRMLFELGMEHYPKDMGFLFHKVYENQLERVLKFEFHPREKISFFVWISAFIGGKRVKKMAEEVLLKTTRGNPIAIQALMIASAANNDITPDALFLLCRQNPLVFMRSVLPSSG